MSQIEILRQICESCCKRLFFFNTQQVPRKYISKKKKKKKKKNLQFCPSALANQNIDVALSQ